MSDTIGHGDSVERTATHSFQTDPDQPVSEAVLAAIATASETDPIDAADEFGPLYEAIDTEALNRLFRSSERTSRECGQVSFRYAGYDVTVDATGRIELDPL